jgi:hypothetical protein
MVEQFVNDAGSVLASSIDNTVTSLSIVSASTFPASGNFRIIIDSEIMLVTAISGTTLTVSRGQEGTIAVAHNAGASVDVVLTKGAMAQFRIDSNSIGTYSSRPTADSNFVGRIYRATDGPYVYRDNGSSWDAFGPIYNCVPLDDSTFSWINQNGASVDSSGGSTVLYNFNTAGTSTSISMRVKTAPSTPYSIEIAFQPYWVFGTSFQAVLFGFRESSSGKLHNYSLDMQSSTDIAIVRSEKWNSATSYSSDYGSLSFGSAVRDVPHFVKIQDDGTNRKFYYSWDGYLWQLWNSNGRTDWITANQIYYGVRQDTNSGGMQGVRIWSWKQLAA